MILRYSSYSDHIKIGNLRFVTDSLREPITKSPSCFISLSVGQLKLTKTHTDLGESNSRSRRSRDGKAKAITPVLIYFFLKAIAILIGEAIVLKYHAVPRPHTQCPRRRSGGSEKCLNIHSKISNEAVSISSYFIFTYSKVMQ